ncbi:MAG TPA: hypothetical protein VJX92_15930 [Methylomirabilota bacterium]|nr:hypothetical protein [Methylomirabilota bacterium]
MLVCVSASRTEAAMAAIETTAAIEDQSDEGIKAAVERAVESAVRGAVAMGLPHVELRGARVLPGVVTVQILARDAAPEPEDDELDAPDMERSTL